MRTFFILIFLLLPSLSFSQSEVDDSIWVAVLQNETNGVILLSDARPAKCNGDYIAGATVGQTVVGTGCWSYANGIVWIVWFDGPVKQYPLNQFQINPLLKDKYKEHF